MVAGFACFSSGADRGRGLYSGYRWRTGVPRSRRVHSSSRGFTLALLGVAGFLPVCVYSLGRI